MGGLPSVLKGGSCRPLVLHALAQLRQDPGQQPRDLHLTDTEAIADLLLGEVVNKTQSKDAALSRPQTVQMSAPQRVSTARVPHRVVDSPDEEDGGSVRRGAVRT